MSWELGSNLFGYLLRQYAPSDTYTIYKYGNRIRVDGSLMGLDDEAKTYMPEWKRSHFSIVLLNPGDHGTDGGKSKVTPPPPA